MSIDERAFQTFMLAMHKNGTSGNPWNLSPAELPYWNVFIHHHKREPQTFAELMGYALHIQQQNAQMRESWADIFGGCI